MVIRGAGVHLRSLLQVWIPVARKFRLQQVPREWTLRRGEQNGTCGEQLRERSGRRHWPGGSPAQPVPPPRGNPSTLSQQLQVAQRQSEVSELPYQKSKTQTPINVC